MFRNEEGVRGNSLKIHRRFTAVKPPGLNLSGIELQRAATVFAPTTKGRRMSKLKMHFHWLDPQVSRAFRSGVSLHGHTSHSRESMNMVPDYARQSRTLSLLV